MNGLARWFGVGVLWVGAGLVHANPPAQVVSAQIEERRVVETLESLGSLAAKESVAIASSVTERVESIHFQDGERVKKGQVLVRLYSQEEQASLDELRIATENARRQYERFLPLFQRGDVSQSILDERKQDLDLARAKEAVMKARLAKLTIVAPFAGQLGVRQISEGALLTQGTVVTQLQDLTELKLDFHVPSRFLKELKEGLEVAATTDAYPGQIFKGVIETVLPQVDRVTRTIQVRAKLDNASGALLPGLLMKVQLQQTPRTALFMPETAVVPMADKQFVYVLKEDENNLFKLMRRQVQLGSREPGWVEVVSGVKAGEWVVSQGALKVRPGQLVKKLEQLNRKSDFADQGDAL